MKRGLHQVHSKILTRSKKQGGLSITDLEKWNRAAVVGLVYRLVAKEDSLWVRFMWKHNIKNKDFWDMKVPQDCSWAWRKILQNREDAAKVLRSSIGDGNSVSFWHDVWASSTPLANLVSVQQRSSSGIGEKEKVCNFIVNGNWDLSLVSLPQYVKDLVAQVPISTRARPDKLISIVNPSGNYSVKSTYEAMQ
ncbi:hypothetical protein FRX31_012687, partial [Thalictrum thalictroides]